LFLRIFFIFFIFLNILILVIKIDKFISNYKYYQIAININIKLKGQKMSYIEKKTRNFEFNCAFVLKVYQFYYYFVSIDRYINSVHQIGKQIL
jgi:hypothetical protein